MKRDRPLEFLTLFALSRGERVDRDPDSLHRDAGRVRGQLHGEEGSDRPIKAGNPSLGSPAPAGHLVSLARTDPSSAR
jgi:hypothetical protein